MRGIISSGKLILSKTTKLLSKISIYYQKLRVLSKKEIYYQIAKFSACITGWGIKLVPAKINTDITFLYLIALKKGGILC